MFRILIIPAIALICLYTTSEVVPASLSLNNSPTHAITPMPAVNA